MPPRTGATLADQRHHADASENTGKQPQRRSQPTSRCRPAQGQRLRTNNITRMPAKPQASNPSVAANPQAGAAPHRGNARSRPTHRGCQRKTKTPHRQRPHPPSPITKQSNKNTKKPTNNTHPLDATSKHHRTLTLTCPRDADKLKRVVRKGMSGHFGKSSAGGGSADWARPGSGM